MLKWFIGLYDRKDQPDNNLVVGSRVRTSLGRGTVTGGSINIRYDKTPKGQHPNDRSHTHNLSDLKLED